MGEGAASQMQYGTMPEIVQLSTGDAKTPAAGPTVPGRGRMDIKGMAKNAVEFAKSDLRPLLADMPVFLLPWILFCASFLPIGLMEEKALSWLAMAMVVIIVAGFWWLSSGRAFKLMAFACLAFAATGTYLGTYGRWKFLAPYHLYSRSPFLLDVLPSDSPEAYRDIGYIGFSRDARIDASKGLGYRSDKLWCVAPILGYEQLMPPASSEAALKQERANFWAVGQDCCQKRGSFSCSDMDKKVHGGIALLDTGRGPTSVISTYKKAVAAAAKTYGLVTPEDPILIRWTDTPAPMIDEMYSDAINYATLASLTALGIVIVALTFLSCLGLNLTKREPGIDWHAEEFEMIAFGFNPSGKTFPKEEELQLGLMSGRCYWSGEVMYDYIFHLANKHLFLGCLFCHPLHPYSKWERVFVGIMICLFIIFPVSAFSLKCGPNGSARTVLLLLFVTIPRNGFKLYLSQIAQEDTWWELKRKNKGGVELSRQAFKWEMSFLLTAAFACAITCFACASYIMAASTTSLGATLKYNSDGIAFAAIVEPLLDLVSPLVGIESQSGSWTLGFFGRWRRERDFFQQMGSLEGIEESGDPLHSEDQKARAEAVEAFDRTAAALAAAEQGSKRSRKPFIRPLFQDFGSELFLGRKERKSEKGRKKSKSGCSTTLQKDGCPSISFGGW